MLESRGRAAGAGAGCDERSCGTVGATSATGVHAAAGALGEKRACRKPSSVRQRTSCGAVLACTGQEPQSALSRNRAGMGVDALERDERCSGLSN